MTGEAEPATGRVGVWRGLAGVSVLAIASWIAATWASGLGRLAPDAVVIALVVGLLIRSAWHPPASWAPGMAIAGRQVLEVAIILLGASTDLRVMVRAGPWLAASVVAVTAFALGTGWLAARRAGLGRTHALLVTSGNAICGNSAIAAVATVVRAPAGEVASSVAYTAILSIGLVLVLPLAGTLAGLSDLQYGALAGMTVYAVPQVLAATYPVSAAAGEVGTLVKLMRVLLLMPWLALLSVLERRRGGSAAGGGHVLARILPPYLLAFILLALGRTAGAVPDAVVPWARTASHALTTVAMAALGLAVEPAAVRSVGRPVVLAATTALVLLVLAALLVATRLGAA